MTRIAVNNPNILIDAQMNEAACRDRSGRPRPDSEPAMLRRLREIRREAEGMVCSSTWLEDCLYRGADYAPDFHCACPVCRSLFPDRLHPRPVRESKYSLDCQVETQEDPELAEDLARLRNDRPRFGSVFLSLGIQYDRKGHGTE
jgi:hypothetical protein